MSKITFLGSKTSTKMSCGSIKGEILKIVMLAPYSVRLFLSELMNGHIFCSISSDTLNHGKDQNDFIPRY